MAPHEKVELIETLTRSGRHVAMIGDGVNDVLAIKRAELGIAMGSGSPASKAVAGLILEGDRFDRLPETLDEGRSILRSIQQTAKLFLTKNVYAFVLIVATYLGLGIPFPFVPQQVTLLNWSVIGIPALAIAASRERTTRPLRGSVLAGPVWFSVRTGLVLGVLGVGLLYHMMHRTADPDRARTIFLAMLILSGIATLQRALSDGDRASRRFLLLGVLSVPMLLLAMYVPLLANFFELSALDVRDWMWAIDYALVGWLALASDRLGRRSDRSHKLPACDFRAVRRSLRSIDSALAPEPSGRLPSISPSNRPSPNGAFDVRRPFRSGAVPPEGVDLSRPARHASDPLRNHHGGLGPDRSQPANEETSQGNRRTGR